MGGYLTPEQRRANASVLRRHKAARWAAEGHVLAAFRRVGASRKPGRATFDPTRAQRPSTRLHGATRHGQRRAAFDARTAQAQAAARAQLEAGDLRIADPLAHKRTGALPPGVASLADYRGRAG